MLPPRQTAQRSREPADEVRACASGVEPRESADDERAWNRRSLPTSAVPVMEPCAGGVEPLKSAEEPYAGGVKPPESAEKCCACGSEVESSEAVTGGRTPEKAARRWRVAMQRGAETAAERAMFTVPVVGGGPTLPCPPSPPSSVVGDAGSRELPPSSPRIGRSVPQGQAAKGLGRLTSAVGTAGNGEAAWEVTLAQLRMSAEDEQRTAGRGVEQARTRGREAARWSHEEPGGACRECGQLRRPCVAVDDELGLRRRRCG
ncbi:uncharacterized protein LOC135115621 [Scylla paramamosain]|uniref:uncharacterized protein LOC135115621 n=1 Tax=Scylla paramamosain TaxID=85552 RepID=UPI003083D64C